MQATGVPGQANQRSRRQSPTTGAWHGPSHRTALPMDARASKLRSWWAAGAGDSRRHAGHTPPARPPRRGPKGADPAAVGADPAPHRADPVADRRNPPPAAMEEETTGRARGRGRGGGWGGCSPAAAFLVAARTSGGRSGGGRERERRWGRQGLCPSRSEGSDAGILFL